MTRRGGAGKGSGSKGRGGAEHGQACTKERTGAVAVPEALESAVQVGRGDEGNRQAVMANPTKCRDSLQQDSETQPRYRDRAQRSKLHQHKTFTNARTKDTRLQCLPLPCLPFWKY
jgi:hypothetical protein